MISFTPVFDFYTDMSLWGSIKRVTYIKLPVLKPKPTIKQLLNYNAVEDIYCLINPIIDSIKLFQSCLLLTRVQWYKLVITFVLSVSLQKLKYDIRTKLPLESYQN